MSDKYLSLAEYFAKHYPPNEEMIKKRQDEDERQFNEMFGGIDCIDTRNRLRRAFALEPEKSN